MAELIRDHALEEALLAAVIADQNDRPRSKQRLVGPSEIGGCRELVRAKMFEPPEEFLPDTHWHTAAHVGTVMGDDLERIFGERLGAETQRRVTAYLDSLGLAVSGAIDMIFVRNQVVCDLKGTGAFGSIQYEGGVKLDYYIQIAVYVMGLVQAGVLQPGASGRIVFYDRVGGEQTFIAVVVPWDAILNYFELAQRRLQEVLNAQAAIEAGQLSMSHHLRDHVPSFCFSEKVQCPRRLHCWGGSDWAPLEVHDDPDLYLASIEYIAGRKLENRGKAMKEQARALLKGVEGHVVAGDQPGGLIGWKNGRISVVEIDALPAVQELVDEIATEMATPVPAPEPVIVAEEIASIEEEVRTETEQLADAHIASVSLTPEGDGLGRIEVDSPGESFADYEQDHGRERDEPNPALGRVAFQDTDPRPMDDLVNAVPNPTPPEMVLERNRDILTPDQIAYLERKVGEAKAEPEAEPKNSAERLSALQRKVAADRAKRMSGDAG